MKRRNFIKNIAVGSAGLAVSGVKLFASPPAIWVGQRTNKVIILGIDGMDPGLLVRFANEGIMPNFKKLIDRGGFRKLRTSLPPQSPVAWSNFITGKNPGGHGIFDFIHRDPIKFIPYLSTTGVHPPSRMISLGNWRIPLNSGKIELLSQSKAFWQVLEEKDIPSTIFKIPSNYPPADSNEKTISGMGTPDILGTYGTFSYYTDFPPENGEEFGGGKVFPVEVIDHKIKTYLKGPVNSFQADQKPATIPFVVYRDAVNPVLKIILQGREILLKEGEWSDWVRVEFEMIPHLNKVSGICRFYVKQVHPHFKLYVTPINVDPANPAIPISTGGYAEELSEKYGAFYTQGFPEDTKALSNGVFTDEEYWEQAKFVLQERKNIFSHELNDFYEGVFFFYFSSIDQDSHMLLRMLDPSHPLYNPNASPDVKNAIRHLYKEMDEVLAQTLAKVDSHTTLMILSDHGFAPFYREFHLSTWLVKNGYTVLLEPDKKDEGDFYDNVDWDRTKAYALGLNSIYINLQDREFNGIVDPFEAPKIATEIKENLLHIKDPANGKKIVRNAYKAQEAYQGEFIDLSPDIIVGYAPGYRISDKATLGKFPPNIIENRKDKWSSDHCMDPNAVPGVFLSNRRIIAKEPALEDLAATVIRQFRVEPPADMSNKDVLESE